MAKNIPGSSAAYPANVRCPTTGDAVDQPAWENGLTDLADRTAFLTAQVGTGGSGVLRIRSAANVLAIKALTGMAVGDLCMVQGTGRIYVFQAAVPQITAAGEAWEPFAYLADDASGYWYSAPDTPSLILIDEQFVSDDNMVAAIGVYVTITGNVDWNNLTDGAKPITVGLTNLMDGDIVEVNSRFPTTGDGTYVAVFRAVVNYDATDHEVPGSGGFSGVTTLAQTIVCNGRYVMPAAKAAATVAIQWKLDNALGAIVVGDVSVMLQVKVYRNMVL